MKRLISKTWILGLVLLVGAVPAVFAQAQRGAIHGTVSDTTDGSPLPGVTVELGGPISRVTTTSAEGDFRFLGLDPGSYDIRATLEGFSTVEHDGVSVRVGRNTTIELSLQPALEEVITVTSESPLLDERKVSRGTSVSQIELEKIPTARDPWAIVTQTPGVLSDRVNVGGSESGQQSVFTAPGSSDDENSFAVDGVVITDMAAIGASPTYYDFDQFEEMQVSTGGTDIEKISAGASLNLVTKRGTNSPRGSARYLLTEADENFGLLEQADADIQDDLETGDGNGGLSAQTLTTTPGNSINEVLDYGFEAGGPIVRDQIWLWGSYGRNDIKQFAQTGDPDNTLLENSAIKVNAQPITNNSLVGSWNRGDKIKDGRRGAANMELAATWNQTGPTEIWKIEDTHVVSSNLYLTGLFAFVDGGFALQSKGGSFPGPAFPTSDSAVALANGEPILNEAGLWANGFYSGGTDRTTQNFQVDGSYFFDTGNMNHELKFGTSYRHFEVDSAFGWAGGRNNTNLTCEGAGTCGFFTDVLGLAGDDIGVAFRSGPAPIEQDYTALWVQDTLSMGNLTVNAGLRYDLQEGENMPSNVVASPLFPSQLPALDFPGNDGGGFEWETISPRVGLTYALGAERKTLLRASYSRFAEQLSTANISRLNPVGISSMSYVFDDTNANSVFDLGEPFTILAFGNVDPSDPDSIVVPSTTDSSLDAPVTDELLFGVEHALLPEFVVGLDVTYRLNSDLLSAYSYVDDNGTKRLRTRDDFEPATTVSSDGVDIPHLPDGTPWTATGWRFRDGLSTIGGSHLTNGDSEVEYLGGSLNFTKRLSNNWMARGYVSYGEAEWDIGDEDLFHQNPNFGVLEGGVTQVEDGQLFIVQSAGSGPFENVFIQSTWSYNLNGMYQFFPDRAYGFNVAANLFGREGYPLPYRYQISLPDTQAGQPTTATVRVTDDVDNFRADDLMVVDLRLEKDIPFTENLSGTISLDAFNVTNDNYVMGRDVDLHAPTANHLTQSMSPRIYRLGFRVNWR